MREHKPISNMEHNLVHMTVVIVRNMTTKVAKLESNVQTTPAFNSPVHLNAVMEAFT